MGPYGAGVEATMVRYGGGYQSVLRHRVTTLEGDWHPPKGVTILEFPSYEQALAWYHSPEYAPLRELRMATGRFDVILVDGISEDVQPTTGSWTRGKSNGSPSLRRKKRKPAGTRQAPRAARCRNGLGSSMLTLPAFRERVVFPAGFATRSKS